jgi:undecaprenyl-diphosphatase
LSLKSYLAIALCLSVVSAVGFSLVALVVNNQVIMGADRSIIMFVQGFEKPILTQVMKFFTFIGSGKSITVLAIIILVYLIKIARPRSEWVLFAFVVIGDGILNVVLKEWFQRTRPDLHRLISISGYSFPSGHSMEAFALYGVISFLVWHHLSTRLARILVVLCSTFMILMIGISRIYLGVHYPSDVIGGYLASGFWLSAAIWFYQYYKEKRYEKSNAK